MSEKTVLSNCHEFELRGGVTLKVYSASLETLALLDPKIKKLESVSEKTSLKEQVEVFVDVVYELIKEDNDIKKEDLKKVLTIEACTSIINKAMGSLR